MSKNESIHDRSAYHIKKSRALVEQSDLSRVGMGE